MHITMNFCSIEIKIIVYDKIHNQERTTLSYRTWSVSWDAIRLLVLPAYISTRRQLSDAINMKIITDESISSVSSRARFRIINYNFAMFCVSTSHLPCEEIYTIDIQLIIDQKKNCYFYSNERFNFSNEMNYTGIILYFEYKEYFYT